MEQCYIQNSTRVKEHLTLVCGWCGNGHSTITNNLWRNRFCNARTLVAFANLPVLIGTLSAHPCGYLGGAASGAQGRVAQEGHNGREQLHCLLPWRARLYRDGFAASRASFGNDLWSISYSQVSWVYAVDGNSYSKRILPVSQKLSKIITKSS